MPIPNNSAQLRTARTDLALDTPNAARRLLALPGVMASPPAITVTTAAGAFPASSIASAVSVPFINNPAFRIYSNNGPFSADGFGFYELAQGTLPSLYDNQSVIEFMFDGQRLEYAYKSRGATYAIRMMVDGNYLSTTPTLNGPLNNWGYAFVDFLSRNVRRITIETDPTNYFGLNIGPNDTVWYPAHLPAQPKVVAIGDSFLSTTTGGPAIVHDCWWAWAARRLGWNIYGSGGSGSGYLNAGSVGGTIRTRINQMAALTPDVWILAGGINDSGSTSPAVTAECIATFQAAKAAAPNSKLIVIGPWGSSGPAAGSRITTRDAVLAAVNTSGALVDAFIDPIALGFITGTGRVGATTGTGNADFYISADGTHPSTAGHQYLGDRIAQQLSTVIDSNLLL